jgi:hypothetical protein
MGIAADVKAMTLSVGLPMAPHSCNGRADDAVVRDLSLMKTHIQLAAALHIALGLLSIFGALVLFGALGLAGSIAFSQGEQEVAGIIGVVAVALGSFLLVLGLPGIIGGWALLTERSWGRPLVLVLGVLSLFNIPIGTAVGIYTLWALLSNSAESPSRIPHTMAGGFSPAGR